MNCEEFSIEQVETDVRTLPEVLQCLLHTIMFNRALGVVRPRDVTSKLFDLTWVQCGDPRVDQHFEEKVREFTAHVHQLLLGSAGQPVEVQLSLNFFDRKMTKNTFFANTEEKIPWEQWLIHLSVSSADRGGAAALEQALRDRMMYILQQVDLKKDHLPKVLPQKPAGSSAAAAGASGSSVGGGARDSGSSAGAGGKDTVLGVTYDYEVELQIGKGGNTFWNSLQGIAQTANPGLS